ncbi:MAG: hypothetical protein IPJ46_14775 [Anaerolineales bacterium]|nr:hypothetical protein [Anaerolineales bacterium]
MKSAESTLVTASEKVTWKLIVAWFVFSVTGLIRTLDTTDGASLSIV